jgi:hypothetical protein
MKISDNARKFVRARRLLAATLDNHRAIFDEVSREWIRSEVEQKIKISEVPAAMRHHDGVKLENIALPIEIQSSRKKKEPRINTNRLPKVESAIAAHILTGIILYGARLYGAGTPDTDRGIAFTEIENDLIIAAMLCDTMGLKDRYSAFFPDEFKTVDDAYIANEFGDRVLEHIHKLLEHLEAFERAFENGATVQLNIPPEYANAIAAQKAANLRLTARAAGDGILQKLDDAKRNELHKRGIDTDRWNGEFPERHFLQRDYEIAKAAVELKGVDPKTIRQPIEEVLLRSVENVLKYGVPPDHLIGPYGTAVHNFHMALPIMEQYSPINRRRGYCGGGEYVEVEGPFALGTLHLTSLEVMRYLHKVRRKGIGTGVGHAFMVAARLESLMDAEIKVPIIAGADCHDVVEDGGLDVTGYDQTLDLFAARFGSPLAALVAEVTDSITKSDGPKKAKTFLEQVHIALAEDVYNIGKLDELRVRATDPDVPYTLAGTFIKIVDTCTTQEEGIRDPDMMEGPWKHSGARLYWDLYSKGYIIQPLLHRLSIEIELSQMDPFYYEKAGAVPQSMIQSMKNLLIMAFNTADQYMTQNLCILASEYKLNGKQRKDLLRSFTNASCNQEGFKAFLDVLLDDDRLDREVRERGFAATYRLNEDKSAERNLDKLFACREAAIWRQVTRKKLGFGSLSEKDLNDVIQLYDSVAG